MTSKLRKRLQREYRAAHNVAELTVRVPCDHSPAGGCTLSIVLREKQYTHAGEQLNSATGKYMPAVGRVTRPVLHRVHATCDHRPPAPEEMTVLRALKGEALASCLAAKTSIIRLVAEHESVRYSDLRRAIEDAPFYLRRAIEDVTDAVTGIASARDKASQPEYNDGRLIDDWLHRKVKTPLGWAFKFERDRQGRAGVYVRFTRAERFGDGWGSTTILAAYKGNGRFSVDMNGLHVITTHVDEHAEPDYAGKRTCGVCGKRVTSLTSHVRTKKHQERAEAAALDLLNDITAAMLRKGNDR